MRLHRWFKELGHFKPPTARQPDGPAQNLSGLQAAFFGQSAPVVGVKLTCAVATFDLHTPPHNSPTHSVGLSWSRQSIVFACVMNIRHWFIVRPFVISLFFDAREVPTSRAVR